MGYYTTEELLKSIRDKPKPKGPNEVEAFDLNIILSMTGDYVSENHCWDETVIVHNLEYDCTLNNCTANVIVEVSHDNFEHIADSTTIELSDGSHIYKLTGSLLDAAYTRYSVNITSLEDGTTPRIHKLIMNVEGLDLFRHVKYMSLDLIVVSRNEISKLMDILMKKTENRDYVLDMIASKARVKRSHIVNILLRKLEDVGYSINFILQMLGIYRSATEDWGQTVDYANIEYDCELNGCEIEVKLQVSDDDFVHIKGETSYILENGHHTVRINDALSSIYARYIIHLKSYTPGFTPRLDFLTMNVEGTGIGTRVSHLNLDMLALKHNNITQFALDLILGTEVAVTYTSSYYIDLLLKSAPSLKYALDLIIGMTQKKEYDIDVLLSNKILSGYLLDVVIGGVSWKAKTYNIDAQLKKLNLNKQNVHDILLHTSDLSKSFMQDVILKLVQQEKYITDVLIKSDNEQKAFYLDTYIWDSGPQFKLYDIDVLLKENNLSYQYLMDVIVSMINTRGYDLDTILKKIESKEYKTDVNLILDNIEVSYGLVVRLIIASYFIDYAKPRTSIIGSMLSSMLPSYNMLVTVSNLSEIIMDKSSLFAITCSSEQLGSVNNLYSLCSYLNTIVSGFEMIPSNNELCNITVQSNNVYTMTNSLSILNSENIVKTSMYNMSTDKDAAN